MQVAVFVQGVDTSATETKGTVLIHSAEQVTPWNYSAFAYEVKFSFFIESLCTTIILLFLGRV